MLQRKLSRKRKESNRRAKAKLALAKLHEKVANQRRDFLHKLSRYYVGRYDVICAEDLAVAGMMSEKHIAPGKGGKSTLHRHIADAGWRAFLDMLAYKAQSAGKLAVFVNPPARRRSVPPAGEPSLKNCGKECIIAHGVDLQLIAILMLLS